MLDQLLIFGGSAVLAAMVMEIFDFSKQRRHWTYKTLSENSVQMHTPDMGENEYLTIKVSGKSRYDTAMLVKDKVPYDLEKGRNPEFHREVEDLLIGAREAREENKQLANYLSERKDLVGTIVGTAHEQIANGQLTRMHQRRRATA